MNAHRRSRATEKLNPARPPAARRQLQPPSPPPPARAALAPTGAAAEAAALAAAWRSRAPAAAPGARGEGGGRPPGKMKAEGGDASMINLSVQQVLSLWAHGTVLRNLTGN